MGKLMRTVKRLKQAVDTRWQERGVQPANTDSPASGLPAPPPRQWDVLACQVRGRKVMLQAHTVLHFREDSIEPREADAAVMPFQTIHHYCFLQYLHDHRWITWDSFLQGLHYCRVEESSSKGFGKPEWAGDKHLNPPPPNTHTHTQPTQCNANDLLPISTLSNPGSLFRWNLISQIHVIPGF